MSAWRTLELSPARLPRWWARFHDDHPAVELTTEAGAAVLTSTDGSVARFTGWFPVTQPEAGPDPAASMLDQLLTLPTRVGIVLVRRGGYAIGLAEASPHAEGSERRRDEQFRLLAHKSGTRYVQGRTAAGGQSQQRFARRRDNQAEELVRTVADRAVAILEPILGGPPTRGAGAGLAVGGDPALVDRVLADPRCDAVRRLPRREFFDIPDPRFHVLKAVVERAATVRVGVHNPE